jgi:TatD DNase family protein
MIIDSHSHLDMEQFDPDREDVIRRAHESGVGIILTIATAKPGGVSVERTLSLAETHESVYAGIGIHPHDAQFADEAYFARMEQWAGHPKVVLLGEIGLDYYYDLSPRETQQEVFCRQLEMARELMLPVSIHCRDAWPDLMVILRREARSGISGGILHSFTGTRDQALECVALGFLISFSGIATFKNAGLVRDAARALSADHILVETDAPFLAPAPHRGKRNEPAFVIDVARSLALTLSVGFEDLAAHTSKNFCRLTGLESRLQ